MKHKPTAQALDAGDVAVVVPLLDESSQIDALAAHLKTLAAALILVDGGSLDGSWERLLALAETAPGLSVFQSAPGRARQMNYGANHAAADWLLFLHADSRLPPGAIEELRTAAAGGHVWGRFDVRFDEPSPALRMIAFFMNRRSALTGVCTGDQGIFVRRETFLDHGGYADIPLMEDVELSNRLKRIARPLRLRSPVTTSARRWRRNGIARTVVTMWTCRLLYWLGIDPAALARRYRQVR